ncbi:MAG: oxygen-independent coproporphyrinogen III oxidase [Spirochaetia bacterium]|nr:oxygen-independent coproporphyrinogen III oxidase [Spirochaetia bacterium]
MKTMVDLGLLAGYSKPGPRYTSYPPANMFENGVGGELYSGSLSNCKRDLSIYVHLPFCERACSFCGCNVIYTRNHAHVAPYLKLLENEIKLVSASLPAGKEVRQIHLGGGTPTFLSSFEIVYLLELLDDSFQISPDAEMSVELDPRVTSKAHIQALASCGFSRASIGIQDIDDRVQKAVNRVQSPLLIEETVRVLRAMGFTSLNVDLIYGLPFQSKESIQRTIEFVINILPQRISCFNFAYIPSLKAHQRSIRPETLPSATERLEILQYVIERLTDAGYDFIGMDHFALKGDALARAREEGTLHRNFQGYTTHGDLDLIGLGVSSISEVADAYFQNYKTMDQYKLAIESGRLATERGHVLSVDDRIRRDVIMKLMCYGDLNFAEIEQAYSIQFKQYFEKELNHLAAFEPEGAVRLRTDGISLSEAGQFVVRNVCMIFDAYTNSSSPAFSPTV